MARGFFIGGGIAVVGHFAVAALTERRELLENSRPAVRPFDLAHGPERSRMGTAATKFELRHDPQAESFDVEEFHLEGECGIRGNRSRVAGSPVSQVRRDD